MRLTCKKCNSTVYNLSVVKMYVVRDDYVLLPEDQYMSILPNGGIDREYLRIKVKRIIYNCQCGEKVIESTSVPKIKDFHKDEPFIYESDIKCKEYGDLIINEGIKRYLRLIRKMLINLFIKK